MPTAELPAEGGKVRLEDYTLNQHKQIQHLLDDSSALDQVNREIQDITDKAANEQTRNRNLKSTKDQGH